MSINLPCHALEIIDALRKRTRWWTSRGQRCEFPNNDRNVNANLISVQRTAGQLPPPFLAAFAVWNLIKRFNTYYEGSVHRVFCFLFCITFNILRCFGPEIMRDERKFHFFFFKIRRYGNDDFGFRSILWKWIRLFFQCTLAPCSEGFSSTMSADADEGAERWKKIKAKKSIKFSGKWFSVVAAVRKTIKRICIKCKLDFCQRLLPFQDVHISIRIFIHELA